MLNTIIALVGLAAALISAGAAVYAVRQVSRLRRSDEWRALEGGVNSITSKQGLLEQRVDTLEAAVSHLPTRADIARVEGAIATVRSEVHDAKKGVDRIEELLLRDALRPGARS